MNATKTPGAFGVARCDGKSLLILATGLRSEQEARKVAAKYPGDIRVFSCARFD